MSLLKNPKVALMIVVVLLALSALALKGPVFGVDFAGGTLFQISLAQDLNDSAAKDRVRSIIQQRLDFSGLKDSSVQVIGDNLVFAQLAETDPRQIERIEGTLLRQGRFEATFDGNVLFTGEDFVVISKDPTRGYRVDALANGFEWTIPFTLSERAARAFTEGTFHSCTLTGFDSAQNRPTYDCPYTYFFLDRPTDAVLVAPQSVHTSDTQLIASGSLRGIPDDVLLGDIQVNAQVPVVLFDGNGLSAAQRSELEGLRATKKFARIPVDTPQEVKDVLLEMGFTLTEIVQPEGQPWIPFALGLKEVIRLSPEVTNQEPLVESLDDPRLKTYASLIIRGGEVTRSAAEEEQKSLTVLLESGSLPVAVSSISKVSISPTLGKSFLYSVGLIGLVAALLVSIILFIRYRVVALVVPMIFTMFAEAIITLGVASALSWPLDLAAIAGVIAAIGYGVDDQIVMTDEMKKRKNEEVEAVSFAQRAKRAFFIVMAAAATVIATMLPLILIGPGAGMARLVGFGFTTIVGVLIGVLITRPAFQEIAKVILQK